MEPPVFWPRIVMECEVPTGYGREMENTYTHPGTTKMDAGPRPELEPSIKDFGGSRYGTIMEMRHEMRRSLPCAL